MKVFEIYEGRWYLPSNEITSLIYEYTTDIDIRSDLEQIVFGLNRNNEVDGEEVIDEFENYFQKRNFPQHKCSTCIHYGRLYSPSSNKFYKEHCNKSRDYLFDHNGCENYKKRGLK